MRIEVHARPSLYRSGIACGWCPCCGVALWSHRSGGRSTGYSGSRGISPLFEATFPRRDEGKTKQTWTWLTRGQVMVSRFNSIFCCLSLLKKIGWLKDLKNSADWQTYSFPIIMELGKRTLNERKLILDVSIFHFHGYERIREEGPPRSVPVALWLCSHGNGRQEYLTATWQAHCGI